MILVAGLSPAWQQVMRLPALRLGEVNRAAEVHWCASGKAVNVAVALARLGAEVELVCTAGGETGASVRQSVARESLAAHWVETAGATRVCTTVVDDASKQVTELVENTPPASNVELDRFQQIFEERAARATLVVLTGSLPAGAPADYFERLLALTQAEALLDVRGAELLAALRHQPLLVKPNREELAQTAGRPLACDEDLLAATEVLRQQGAQWVAISDGDQPLWLFGPDGRLRFSVPRQEVVNPIGSGDCLAAGIAWGIQQEQTLPEALCLGMAAAAENVTTLLPCQLNRERVRAVAATIRSQDV